MQHESKLNESPLTTTGHLRVAQENARHCWNTLVTHCQSNYCNCHLDVGGSVHLVQGCVTGLMLWDEWNLATARVRARTPVLEAGDMESTLEPQRGACPDGDSCGEVLRDAGFEREVRGAGGWNP